jgi:deoxyribodipyrimidine photo-lyase
MRTLLWLRRDLRVRDHPALVAAAGAEELLPVFCFDDRLLHGRHASGPRTQFLLDALADLNRSLRGLGSRLFVRRGLPERVLLSLAREVGAERVHFSCDVGPFARERDRRVAESLGDAGIEVRGHPGVFVADDLGPLATGAGAPYTVFTPFYRKWSAANRRPLEAAPRRLPPPPAGIDPGELPTIHELGLRQEVSHPTRGGEGPAREQLAAFLAEGVTGYASSRDMVGRAGTSRFSQYLHLGCLSAREIEHSLGQSRGDEALRRQLCWRDFYAHVLLHFPANAHSEHQARYRGTLSYSDARRRFEAWCEGRTGFPFVDAGMRQLWEEGWMHNRARLVVGSFLTKDLGIDWRWGERWFMRLLVDGDEANNNGNWQWIASVGVDPQPPYRRAYNPARQQARFDPDGTYVRRYVPELREVPLERLTEPWEMTVEEQRRAGCSIGRDYPAPIVDHRAAREQALARYAAAAVR